MKLIIATIVILCLCGCFGKRPTLETGHEGKTMPSMKLLMLDSTTAIDTKTWMKGKPVVLIDFSPFCPYCRAVTQKIIDENKDLSDIQFVFLSQFPITTLKNYTTEYKLKSYSNITVAWDNDGSFGKYFNSPGVPCIAIYNKDRLLKQVLMGKVNAGLIKDIALE
ncbi:MULTISPECIES: TlpA family protein disulfide reductase [Niastella]|uniref:Redoxin family protein n=1 Tax=Niastella soli TaxID=2821487 RepID=A0ABS3Z378_9BACT|nr:redoxin family protein [Niastella soli]MBO9204615.1 redoxin family protein [Niastella soli]